MDPSEFYFDIKSYKRQSEIEERYIVSRLRKRQNKREEDCALRSKRKHLNRDHVAANKRPIDNYFVDQLTYDNAILW